MYLELEKIKQAATYLAEKIDDLYSTKFLKLMYYFDFISVLERGVPITNDTYYHLPYGPVPTVIKDQLGLLRSENKKEEENVFSDDIPLKSIFSDVLKMEVKKDGFIIKNIKPADLNYISEYEKRLLDDIIEQFKGIKTKELVGKTHQEAPYLQTPPNNIISYRLAFFLDRKSILPDRDFSFSPELSQAEFFNR